MTYYVYRHIRLDKGTPFYVGKGKNNRLFDVRERNSRWQRIVNKVGYKAEIVKTFEDESEAYAFEKQLVELYKGFSFCEANLVGGGRGGLSNPSEETRQKLSANRKGRKHTEETKKKTSEALKGKKKSPEAIANMKGRNGVHMLGRKASAETKAKISQANSGINNFRYGKQGTTEKQAEWIKHLNSLNLGFVGYWVTPLGQFKTMKEAAEAHGISKSTVEYRCKISKSAQFSSWSFLPKESAEDSVLGIQESPENKVSYG